MDGRTDKWQLYFSTDDSMDGREVLDYYRTRFQLEFCFRDGKQHRRTASMFDRVIVVVMHNYHKPNSYFSAIERVGLITRCVKDLDNVVVDMHDGLL